MSERGHEVVEVLQRPGEPLEIENLEGCDLVHIHGLLLAGDEDDCLSRLQAAGAAVGLDEEGDPDAVPPELAELLPEDVVAETQRIFARLLARASDVDLVTAPSDDLADRFEEAGADNVHAIDSYLPGAFNRVKPVGHEGIVIGWEALPEHRLDGLALGVEPALEQLLDRHPDVHVVTIGLELDIAHERYRHEDFLPLEEVTARMADFDVGIFPLADTPYNRARSNVKAREYAAAGVPWLASPVGPYRGLGEDEGGWLVEDGDWLAALEELAGSAKRRARLQKRAKKWAQRETIWKMADVWERTFLDTITDVRTIA